MLTTLQIVLLSIAGASALGAIVFFILFLRDVRVERREQQETAETKSIYSAENIVINVNTTEPEKEESINDMLANLDEQTKDEVVEEPIVEVVEVQNEVVEEVAEETVEEKTEEVAEPVEEEVAEPVVEEVSEETVEEVVEEKKEEVVEETAETEEKKEEIAIEEVANVEGSENVEITAEDEEILSDIEELKNDATLTDVSLDYNARLAKITENRDKIERDLAKIQKAILKYERTKRRKNRNQKMLDRRASELTNLNLVMYSVTDIKNVDEDKKVKQEELTAHIAELKASIQDADEFIESNKEKNEHNVKMAKFLLQEKSRYNEEITELQKLVNKADETETV